MDRLAVGRSAVWTMAAPSDQAAAGFRPVRNLCGILGNAGL